VRRLYHDIYKPPRLVRLLNVPAPIMVILLFPKSLNTMTGLQQNMYKTWRLVNPVNVPLEMEVMALKAKDLFCQR
jgi:hypothetical protein